MAFEDLKHRLLLLTVVLAPDEHSELVDSLQVNTKQNWSHKRAVQQQLSVVNDQGLICWAKWDRIKLVKVVVEAPDANKERSRQEDYDKDVGSKLHDVNEEEEVDYVAPGELEEHRLALQVLLMFHYVVHQQPPYDDVGGEDDLGTEPSKL